MQADTNKYFGVIGKRVTIDVTCIKRTVHQVTCNFTGEIKNLVICHLIEHSKKALIVVKSSSYDLCNEGEVIKIKGTVKQHSQYQGQRQTFINRVNKLV